VILSLMNRKLYKNGINSYGKTYILIQNKIRHISPDFKKGGKYHLTSEKANAYHFSFIKFESGLDSVQIDLKENATITDLVNKLTDEYGEDLMKYIRNKDTNRLHALFMNKGRISQPDDILHDQDEIKVMPAIAGG